MSVHTTWRGFIAETQDALLIFQAVLEDKLPVVVRRPHERERQSLIQPGAVFVYNEQDSGIRRWTDGVSWSPSRILGNFLIYRECLRSVSGSDRRSSNKRGNTKRRHSDLSEGQDQNELVSPCCHPEVESMGMDGGFSFPLSSGAYQKPSNSELSLYGSLTEGYPFKGNGLMKKTISITYGDKTWHLISYYSAKEVQSKALRAPSQDPFFSGIQVCDELFNNKNFRFRPMYSVGDIRLSNVFNFNHVPLEVPTQAGYHSGYGAPAPAMGHGPSQSGVQCGPGLPANANNGYYPNTEQEQSGLVVANVPSATNMPPTGGPPLVNGGQWFPEELLFY